MPMAFRAAVLLVEERWNKSLRCELGICMEPFDLHLWCNKVLKHQLDSPCALRALTAPLVSSGQLSAFTPWLGSSLSSLQTLSTPRYVSFGKGPV